MTTTIRRTQITPPVADPIDVATQAAPGLLRHLLVACRRRSAVRAICCPLCRIWVKPRHFRTSPWCCRTCAHSGRTARRGRA